MYNPDSMSPAPEYFWSRNGERITTKDLPHGERNRHLSLAKGEEIIEALESFGFTFTNDERRFFFFSGRKHRIAYNGRMETVTEWGKTRTVTKGGSSMFVDNLPGDDWIAYPPGGIAYGPNGPIDVEKKARAA